MSENQPKTVQEALNKPYNRNDPMYNFYDESAVIANGNNYSYLRMGGRGVLDRLKSVIAPINPFAIPFAATYKRQAATPQDNFYHDKGEPYPNPTIFTSIFPSHYDPLKTKVFGGRTDLKHNQGLWKEGVPQTVSSPLPLACVRGRKNYERCVMINGKEKCQDEGMHYLATCPNWALKETRKTILTHENIKAVQLKEYEEAMKVSDYNKGRTLRDVDLSKTWADGDRHHLRPDSLWADDRYADVTEEEIEAAKKRVGENELRQNIAAHAHHGHHEEHGHDDKHAKAHNKH